MLLHEEMGRVFQGMVRLDRLAEEIRHREHGSLRIGVMPALSTGFVQDIVARLVAAVAHRHYCALAEALGDALKAAGLPE
jgi:hypothetical protein